MPTIEEIRSAFPIAAALDDQTLQSPWFHIGALRTGLVEGDRLKLCLDVIEAAISTAPGDA